MGQALDVLIPAINNVFAQWLLDVYEGPDNVKGRFCDAMLGHEPFREEHQVRCLNGDTRWVITAGMPSFSADGRFDGFSVTMIDITERHAALEDASQSAASYRIIVENSLDLIAQVDVHGNYVDVSSSYTQVTGWESKELIGRPVFTFLHPDDVDYACAAMRNIFSNEECPDFVEVRKRHRNGRYVLLRTKMRKVADRVTGAIVSIVLVSHDSTSETEMLNRIERMAEQNTALIENSPDVMMSLDLTGKILHANRAVEHVLDCRPAELVGRTGLLFMTEKSRTEILGNLTLLKQGQEINSSCVECQCKKGKLIQLDWSMSRPKGSNLIYARARDVTERNRTLVALEEAHTRVHNILESIEDSFFSVNGNWEITYANTISAEFVGIDRDASLGKILWDVVPSLEHTPVAIHLRTAMKTRQNSAFEVYYEPAGVWLSERVYAHEDGLSVFFHDISERKRAEAKLELLATRDVLTGLPNRAWLDEHVKTLLSREASDGTITLLFIDLNHFKEVNDSMGHAVGDRLLQEVSKRLEASMRPGDVVARLGGDEFVVAANCTGQDAAAAIAQRLIAQLTIPFDVDETEICVGASIGISLSDRNAMTAERLFQNADIAMYRAKATGRSSYQFFMSEMNESQAPTPI